MLYFAKFYGVRCTYNDQTTELSGRGPISEALLNLYAVPLAQFVEWATSLVFPDHEPEFPLKIGEPWRCPCCGGELENGVVYHKESCRKAKP